MQLVSEHRSCAKGCLAASFRRRAPYNPNFNASAWCAKSPPAMPRMIPRMDSSVFSVFSLASRCFHPITMISDCLQSFGFRTQRVVLMWFGTYWDANFEKVSVLAFSSVTLVSMSLHARSTSGLIWNYTQQVLHSTPYGKISFGVRPTIFANA